MKTNKRIFAGILFFFAAVLAFAEPPEGSMRRFGIFIGSNNGGKERVMLHYAISDAQAMSKVFKEMGGIADGDSILLVEPTIREVNNRIDALREQVLRSRGVYKRTEIVFYYSGHSDEEGLLLNRERYPYRDLRSRINNIPSDMRIVILDSCASGAFTRIKGGSKTQPFLVDSSLSAEGYAFLTSSSADEASQESDRIRASYFTHSLVSGLRGAADSVGDGRVTLNELYRFAYTATMAMTETSMYGAQHPSYDIQVNGTGDVVLTDIKETSAALAFDEKITGRLSIRDSSDHLIAEINKTAARPLELGLEPGSYRITLQQGEILSRAQVTLVEGKRALVAQKDFTVISGTPARLRGDGEEEKDGEEDEAEMETPQERNTLYTFFYNNVSEPFPFPLFGFVNIARGNHRGAQFGFINRNTGTFEGIQGSFVNTAGGDTRGVQAGFINTVVGNIQGAQFGFTNTAAGNIQGAQFGFINTDAGNLKGAQFGFVNTAAGDTRGAQYGFVNTTSAFNGAQFGFVNIAAKESRGIQAGFVNTSAQKVNGVQIGFINYSDSIENGVPLGFISIVRHGGYRAVEYSFSEFYPVTMGFKLGVEKLYTSFYVGYNPFTEFGREHPAFGLGLGSIFSITNVFFFNPEINAMSAFSREKGSAQLQSIVPLFGFRLGKHFSVTAGPSVSLASSFNEAEAPEPLFSIMKYTFNKTHDIMEHSVDASYSIVVGARAGVRVSF